MPICRLKNSLSSFLLLSFCTFFFLFPSEAKSKEIKITLFHLNDTYHVGPVPVKERNEINKEVLINKGGMSRIRALVTTYQNNNPEISVLVLHAGDILSPSLLSSKEGLKGKQMIDVLNHVPVDIAVFGNHEFDFGCKNLEKRVQESTFIWLASNIKFPSTSSVFKKVKTTYIFEHQGIKIGFFGLTIDFLSEIPCRKYGDEKIIFQNPVETAKQVVRALKNQNVDVIIGITHLKMSTDKEIARENPGIDVIIGGHEHVPLSALVGKTLIRKAGTNATNLGKIELTYSVSSQNKKPSIKKKWELIPVDDKIHPDLELKKIVDSYQARIQKYRVSIGETATPLEARSICMRTHETNTGNLVADVMRKKGKGDLALINGGAFRANKIFNAGPITAADIYALLPYNDKIVTIKIDGKTFIDALENGLANWGSTKGRFPQVSGVKFEFDPGKPDYKKIIKSSIEVNGNPIQLNKMYELSTNDFLAERGGIDGYNMLQGKEVSGEYGLLTDVLIDYIRGKKTISPILDQRIVIHGTNPLIHYKCGEPEQVF